MIAKVAIFLAVVAVAYGGAVGVVSVAHTPAATVPIPHHVAVASPAVVTTYSAGPVHHVAAAPVAYSAPAVVAAPVGVAYHTAPKVIHTVEPVEQHGYKIVY